MRRLAEGERRPRSRPVGLLVVALIATASPVGYNPAPTPPRLSMAGSGPSPTAVSGDPAAFATPAPTPASTAAPSPKVPPRRPRPATPAVTPIGEVGDDPEPLAHALPAERLQDAVEQWLTSRGGVRSVAAAIAYSGDRGRLWTGEAHLGDPLFHAGDEYGILSITKTFTEALVLREVGAGRIDLDAPMPAIAGLDREDAGPPLTPRMLLQHTSGLVNYPKAVGFDPTRPITPREIVALALHSPRLFAPGTTASYSNTNFHWLGLLLEEVTGQSYADLVAGLADELGLTHTRLDTTGRPGWTGFSSGGVRSTIGDLARWGAALFTPDRLLAAPQLVELTTIGAAGVALGLWALCPCRTDPDGSRHALALRQTVAHGGFFFYPARDLVIVVHYEPGDAAVADGVGASLASALHRVLEDVPAE